MFNGVFQDTEHFARQNGQIPLTVIEAGAECVVFG